MKKTKRKPKLAPNMAVPRESKKEVGQALSHVDQFKQRLKEWETASKETNAYAKQKPPVFKAQMRELLKKDKARMRELLKNQKTAFNKMMEAYHRCESGSVAMPRLGSGLPFGSRN